MTKRSKTPMVVVSEASHTASPRLRRDAGNIITSKDGLVIVKMPSQLDLFNGNVVSVEKILRLFDWEIRSRKVLIDFSETDSSSSQTLSLIILYMIHLQFTNSCGIQVKFKEKRDGRPSKVEKIWHDMGADGWKNIAKKPNRTFDCSDRYPIHSIREYGDFTSSLERIGKFLEYFDIAYIETLRYIISELMYNSIEHGCYYSGEYSGKKQLPALVAVNKIESINELHIVVADLGIGIKRHLENFIPGFEDHASAIRKSLEPKISGTFGRDTGYRAKNNAGFGLYMSSSIASNLRGDMYVVSGTGRVHVSPKDITAKEMSFGWPGTLVFIKVRLDKSNLVNIDEIMSKIRQASQDEIQEREKIEVKEYEYFSMYNYFGNNAENKGEAINFRERHLTPALSSGKRVKLDFSDVKYSPHSFLNALLADSVRLLGDSVYKMIKIVNAGSQIRDTIDYIYDENL